MSRAFRSQARIRRLPRFAPLAATLLLLAAILPATGLPRDAEQPADWLLPLDAASAAARDRLEAAHLLLFDGCATGAVDLLSGASRPATAELNLLGIARFHARDLPGAFAALRAACDADARFLAAHVNLGYLLFREKRFDELERRSRALIAARPGDGDALLGLGLAAYGHRAYETAANLLERARDALDRAGNPRAEAAREYLGRARAVRRRLFTRPPAPARVP